MPHLEWNAPRIPQVRPRLRLFTSEGHLTLQRDGGLEWARYDLAGRWRVALVQGLTYRRALSGRLIAIRYFLEEAAWLEAGEEGFHEVEAVTEDEGSRLHETVRAWAGQALDAFGPDLPDPWKGILERAHGMDPVRLEQDVQGFHGAYQGDPITPPDQRDAVLLQSTTGCAHNQCSFCVFYRHAPFTIRPAPAFREHVEAVRCFLAPTLPARHHVFFGDASALMVKPSLLAQHFETAATLLEEDDRPGEARGRRSGRRNAEGPFSTFCDAFRTPLPPVDELRELARLGLGRVYVGIESGAQELLDLLNKPATPEGMLDAVARLRAAGVRVSAIVMIGAGGHDYVDLHRRETVDLLTRMNLGTGDIVQFSEFFCRPGCTYEAMAVRLGLKPLSRLEARLEMRRLRDELGGLNQPAGPRYQMYDARQLLY